MEIYSADALPAASRATAWTDLYSQALNRVDVFFGTGSFADEQTIEVVCANGVVEKLVAKHIIIATGSRPYRPADIDFHHPRIYDSDTILSLGHTPRKLIVYGAGVIGCEYASIFSGLGVLVELVDNRGQLLRFLDSEISQALSYHFCYKNITVRHNEDSDRVEGVDNDWRRLPQQFDASILSDEATAPGFPSFTGAFVGVACQDMAGTALPADFDFFEYRERSYRMDPFNTPTT